MTSRLVLGRPRRTAKMHLEGRNDFLVSLSRGCRGDKADEAGVVGLFSPALAPCHNKHSDEHSKPRSAHTLRQWYFLLLHHHQLTFAQVLRPASGFCLPVTATKHTRGSWTFAPLHNCGLRCHYPHRAPSDTSCALSSAPTESKAAFIPSSIQIRARTTAPS